MLAAVVALWRTDARAIRILQALVVLLLMVRFAVPPSVAENGMVYRAVMAPEYNAAIAALEKSPTEFVSKGERYMQPVRHESSASSHGID